MKVHFHLSFQISGHNILWDLKQSLPFLQVGLPSRLNFSSVLFLSASVAKMLSPVLVFLRASFI